MGKYQPTTVTATMTPSTSAYSRKGDVPSPCKLMFVRDFFALLDQNGGAEYNKSEVKREIGCELDIEDSMHS